MCECPDLGKTVVWGEEAKTQMMGQKPNLGMKDPNLPSLLYNFVKIHLSFRFLVSSLETWGKYPPQSVFIWVREDLTTYKVQFKC